MPATLSVPRALSRSNQPRAVIVGRIAIDRVDVIEVAPLGSVLDQNRWALNAVVRNAAVLGGATPGEIRARQIGADFRHSSRGAFVIENADPFVREVEKHGLLTLVQRRRENTFRLDCLAVFAR